MLAWGMNGKDLPFLNAYQPQLLGLLSRFREARNQRRQSWNCVTFAVFSL